MRFCVRIAATRTIIVIIFLALLVRLGYIPLFLGKAYAVRAVGQRAVDAPIRHVRGCIYDRNMQPLAGDGVDGQTIHCVGLFPRQLDGDPETVDAILRLLCQEGNAGENQNGAQNPAVGDESDVGALGAGRIEIGTGTGRVITLDEERWQLVSEMCRNVQGVFPFTYFGRYRGIATHALGYVDGSGVGADGLERSFNWALSGGGTEVARIIHDGNMSQIPGLGGRIATLGSQGGWVRTTIDRRVQCAAEEAFDRRAPGSAGAVVVLDVPTGDVLAMVSRPSFDADNVGRYLRSDNGPMINRAVRPYYPGSVYKTVVAAAALESGAFGEDSVYYDTGSIEVGVHTFRCHAADRGGHGDISFRDAMAQSCNTAFIYAAQQVGAHAISEMGKAMGIGVAATVDDLGLPSARSGRSGPSKASGAELANMALGQAVVEMTPLEAAVMMAAVASSGVVCQPRLVIEAVRSEDVRSDVRTWQHKEQAEWRCMSKESAVKLQEMLRAVVVEGTAARVLGSLNAAGKTGTAQTGRLDQSSGEQVYNAWFAGWAPSGGGDADGEPGRPQLAIAVLVEGTVSGAEAAAPIFGDIVRTVLGE